MLGHEMAMSMYSGKRRGSSARCTVAAPCITGPMAVRPGVLGACTALYGTPGALSAQGNKQAVQ